MLFEVEEGAINGKMTNSADKVGRNRGRQTYGREGAARCLGRL
jgi:hypothetical protein